LRNSEYFDEIANAELSVIEQEPKHLEPGLVSQDLEKRCRLFHEIHTSRE
jgi:hypothetical protein